MRVLIRFSVFVLFATLLQGFFDGKESARAQESATQVTVPGTDDLSWLEAYRAAAEERWAKSIAELEALDKAEDDPSDAILFIGSSSIRRWEDLSVDMAPYRTVRRGYGGARFSDVAIFAERLIHPHQYRALVMFVGNDVVGKPTDRTPEELEQLVEYVVGVSHQHSPGTPVFIIEITPTDARFPAWPKIRQANAILRDISLRTADTYFIPTAGIFLRPDGSPRSELFAEDRLHLNEQGYDLWSIVIRRRLDDVFRLIAESESKSAKTTLAASGPAGN
tara:strand:- start:976709 stop:977542 length:834 start_codon:yes stop_codon:yes gene_type:complete